MVSPDSLDARVFLGCWTFHFNTASYVVSVLCTLRSVKPSYTLNVNSLHTYAHIDVTCLSWSDTDVFVLLDEICCEHG